MQTRIQLGAEVDFVSKGELDQGLDEIKGMFPKERAKPTFTTRMDSGFMPVSGGLVLDLGSPPVGRMWNVVTATAFGSDDNTTVTDAQVALYFGNPDTITLMSLKVPGLTVPSFTSFTKGVLWCYDSQNLVANVTGAASGTQVGVNLTVIEWREEDIASRSGR